jgi:hypothetical protein
MAKQFHRAHDIVSTPDCKHVFVAEIGPNVVWKFAREDDYKNEIVGVSSSPPRYLSTVVISFVLIVVIVAFCLYKRRMAFSSSSYPYREN